MGRAGYSRPCETFREAGVIFFALVQPFACMAAEPRHGYVAD